jgi:uncharacterized protein (TIGR02300 family)
VAWHVTLAHCATQRDFTFDRHFLCRYGPTKFSGQLSPPFRRRYRRNTQIYKDATVAKPELGTKRICPETGRKFYDLNKDPIISPYTGKSYPLSFFDDTKSEIIEEKAEKVEEKAELEEEEEEDVGAAEVVSLEDAEEEEDTSKDENLPDLGDNTDDELEIDDDEDDTFLAEDEDEDDDDVTDIIDVAGGDDDES